MGQAGGLMNKLRAKKNCIIDPLTNFFFSINVIMVDLFLLDYCICETFSLWRPSFEG